MALPSGYTKVEYIQSSGSQYIDTGFKPNQDTRIVCRAKLAVGSSTNWLFGARYSSSSKKFTFAASQSGYYTGGYGASNLTFSTDCNTVNSFTVDANKGSFTVTTDAFAETKEVAYSSFTTPVNLTLFAGNTNGTLTYGSATVYSCQIYDNGTLVRNFVPCKNASSVAGLYDTVNGIFYENKGSGTFAAGAEVLPDYKVVDANELDEAIGATANAIRTKTGDSAKITWNASRGFASAVEAISDGGGTQVATGTFTKQDSIYTNGYVSDEITTITGLGFTPTRVIFFVNDEITEWDYGILFADSKDNKYTCFYEFEEYDYDTEEYRYIEAVGTFAKSNSESGGFTITFNSDGFSVSADSVGTYSQLRWIENRPYTYVAIG